MSLRKLLAAPLLGTLLVVGCAQPEEADDTPPQRKVVRFQGKPEARYAGAWQTGDGVSSLELREDGSLGITSVARSQNGKQVTTATGKWSVQGKDLYLSYSSEGQPAAVVKYVAELASDTLKLTQPNGLNTVYHRK